jgi:hypothetical protein
MEKASKLNLRQLGENLCKLGYREIESRLVGLHLDSDSLIQLLNHKSRKVGDTAFSLLDRRSDGPQLVVEAILSDRFTHKIAKIRATNFLAGRGRSCPEAMKAYLHLLCDRNAEVVGNALFGVVFFQDQTQMDLLERRRDALPARDEVRTELEGAIRALREENPFLFSPGFHDAGDVWKLDRRRFGDRIGKL